MLSKYSVEVGFKYKYLNNDKIITLLQNVLIGEGLYWVKVVCFFPSLDKTNGFFYIRRYFSKRVEIALERCVLLLQTESSFNSRIRVARHLPILKIFALVNNGDDVLEVHSSPSVVVDLGRGGKLMVFHMQLR